MLKKVQNVTINVMIQQSGLSSPLAFTNLIEVRSEKEEYGWFISFETQA